jgi:hypothetical protein
VIVTVSTEMGGETPILFEIVLPFADVVNVTVVPLLTWWALIWIVAPGARPGSSRTLARRGRTGRSS